MKGAYPGLARRRILLAELTMQQAGMKVGNWNPTKAACCSSCVVAASKHFNREFNAVSSPPLQNQCLIQLSAPNRTN